MTKDDLIAKVAELEAELRDAKSEASSARYREKKADEDKAAAEEAMNRVMSEADKCRDAIKTILKINHNAEVLSNTYTPSGTWVEDDNATEPVRTLRYIHGLLP